MGDIKFTIKTVEKHENGKPSKRHIIVAGHVVGEVTSRHDYVLRKETDRIRTKWASVNGISWNEKALSAWLGREVKHQRGDYDLRNHELRYWVENYLTRFMAGDR
jgi:hypothetical protein